MAGLDRFRRISVAATFRPLLARTERGLCAPGQLPVSGIHRVLVIRANHRLGNAVLISPLISELQTLYPGAEIDILSAGHAAEFLYQRCDQVRRVLEFPRRIPEHPWAAIKVLRELRHSAYDLAIDASLGSNSGRLLLALANANHKLGYPDRVLSPHSPWFDTRWPAHHAHLGVHLLRTAHAGPSASTWPLLHIPLSEVDVRRGKQALARIGDARPSAELRIRVGVFTDATGAKRHGSEWWLQFIEQMQRFSPRIELVEFVAASGKSHLGDRFASFYTTDLRRLASACHAVDAFISADCGVMHLAAASGTPTLGLFCASDASRYGPYGNANRAIDTRQLAPESVALAAAEWIGRARDLRLAA